MNTKETPEETFARCVNQIHEKYIKQNGLNSNFTVGFKYKFEIADLYQKERNKQIAPTDDEISYPQNTARGIYYQGVKWAIKHFTGE